jgi:hypothetical protein
VVNLIWDKREHSLLAVATLIRFKRTAALDVAVALNRRGHCLSVGTFGTSFGNDMLKCYNKWHIFCSYHFFSFLRLLRSWIWTFKSSTRHCTFTQPKQVCAATRLGIESIYMYPSLCHSKNNNVNNLTPLDLESRCRSKKKGVLGYCNKIPR